MKEAPIVVRYLPWLAQEKSNATELHPAAPHPLHSLPPLIVDTAIKPASHLPRDIQSLSPARTGRFTDLVPAKGEVDGKKSTSAVASPIAARPAAADGTVAIKKAAAVGHPPATASPVIATPLTADSSNAPSSLASPITPLSATTGNSSTTPFPTMASIVVELPGSILMDNAGFPTPNKTKLNGRPHESEKLPSGLIRRLDSERTTGPSGGRARKSSTVFGRCELDASSPLILPRKLDHGTLASRRMSGETARERMLARKGRVPNDSQSEIERVGKVLARRIQGLERELKERDKRICSYEERYKKQEIAHDKEIGEMAARQTKELTTLQERLKAQAAAKPSTPPPRYDEHPAAGNVPSITVIEAPPTSADAETVATLELKVANAMQCVQNLREQGEAARRRQQELSAQLSEVRSTEKELRERIGALEQERERLSTTVTARDEQMATLQDLVQHEKEAAAARLDETAQQLATARREVEERDGRREDVERRCIFLRNRLAEREDTIKELQSAISGRASTPLGQHESPSSPESNGCARNAMVSPVSDLGRAEGAAQEPGQQMQQLEATVRSQGEDIRLYKLDVRGYKKDVRIRDAKIRELEQRIGELQRSLLERGGDVEIAIGLDLDESQGLGIRPQAETPPRSDSREGRHRDPGAQTPPMTPPAATHSSRTPMSRYHTPTEIPRSMPEPPPSPSPWRPHQRERAASPSPLRQATPPPGEPDLVPSPLAFGRRDMTVRTEVITGLRPRPEGSPRRPGR